MEKIIINYNKHLKKFYTNYPKRQRFWYPGDYHSDDFAPSFVSTPLRIQFQYTGTDEIKYITIWIVAYNEVGDVVPKRLADSKLKGDGLLKGDPQVAHKSAWGNRYDYFFGDLIHRELSYKFCKDIAEYEIILIKLDFMDGTCLEVKGEDIEYKPVNPNSGCYVATCVYGSYDCPEVWTLRRYRDDTLGASWYGRLFIRTYYAISPTLVKWFGKTKWFKCMWRGRLDRMVKKLQDKGVESTPYKDKNW